MSGSGVIPPSTTARGNRRGIGASPPRGTGGNPSEGHRRNPPAGADKGPPRDPYKASETQYSLETMVAELVPIMNELLLNPVHTREILLKTRSAILLFHLLKIRIQEIADRRNNADMYRAAQALSALFFSVPNIYDTARKSDAYRSEPWGPILFLGAAPVLVTSFEAIAKALQRVLSRGGEPIDHNSGRHFPITVLENIFWFCVRIENARRLLSCT